MSRKNTIPVLKHRQPARELREAVVSYLLERDGPICGICQKNLGESKFHIDHIIPVAFGGTNILSNLRLTHSYCNLKSAASIRYNRKEKLNG